MSRILSGKRRFSRRLAAIIPPEMRCSPVSNNCLILPAYDDVGDCIFIYGESGGIQGKEVSTKRKLDLVYSGKGPNQNMRPYPISTKPVIPAVIELPDWAVDVNPPAASNLGTPLCNPENDPTIYGDCCCQRKNKYTHSGTGASSQSKNKPDDDLFWGPLDHSKQEVKKADFPQLANQGSWPKNTPGKGATMSRQKSGSGRAVEASLSSSPSLKGKRNVMAKHSGNGLQRLVQK
ncbi:unnamed protein product [Lactuca virosa]|uniref:DUF4005 domain-containing protein n=1 Tax=Lactuca virosa TaxID=75947 RepID=A0AAU9LTX3_9ASTR|nr:unnamed protein product [Lactuca virosa]